MTYTVPSIPHLRLAVTLIAEEPASLPGYHGSMLRGAFGHALRRLACRMGPGQECAACPLRRECAYARIFETFVEGTPPPFLRGIDRAVRPYVFEPREGGGRLEPGDPLRFDLLLLGRAVELQAHAVLALERMAWGGLGSGRARFRLDRVEAPDPSGTPRRLFSEGRSWTSEPLAPAAVVPADLPAEAVALHLVTPLRLKVRDQLAVQLRFRDLAFHMLRRILELAHFHAPGAELDWTFQPLLQKAQEVRLRPVDLRWKDWERWSQRQQSAMKLGGLMGTLELEGDLAPFAPLLRTAEVVHVGKGATFGLGKVVLKAAA